MSGFYYVIGLYYECIRNALACNGSQCSQESLLSLCAMVKTHCGTSVAEAAPDAETLRDAAESQLRIPPLIQFKI